MREENEILEILLKIHNSTLGRISYMVFIILFLYFIIKKDSSATSIIILIISYVAMLSLSFVLLTMNKNKTHKNAKKIEERNSETRKRQNI